MASTLQGRRLTEQHRLAQARLGALTATQMASLWRLLDPSALTDTVPAWLNASVRLVSAQHGASALLARRYFQAFRVAEVGAPLAGSLASPAFVEDAVRTSLMVTGPVRIERARRRGEPIAQAARIALSESARAAQRHTLTGGRDQLMSAVQGDSRAVGWARVTSGNACSFCALLAGRGAVYRGEGSADFHAHDGCSCTAEPAYSRTAPLPASSQQYAELYAEAARGQSDPLNAFRRAYEGRD
jgi:hypothetical protein